MSFDKFVLYFVLPATTILFVITNRFYYSRKETTKTRFNIPDDLFVGNILASLIVVIGSLGMYAYILNIRIIYEIKWEMLSLVTIAILALIIGLGTGGHIAALNIERTLDETEQSDKLKKVLHFYHWPFGHKLTYVPAFLIVYILILLDLFRGHFVILNRFELLILSGFAIIAGLTAWITFVITHVTKLMFFTLAILLGSIMMILITETITLMNHQIAYFFTITFTSAWALLTLYRYSHHVSESVHWFIHSKFPKGDKIVLKRDGEAD